MGLFDRLKRPADTPASSSQRPESEAAGPDLSASPSAQAPSVSGVPGQDLLDSATISPTSEFAGAPEVSGRFYNPYEGLNQSLDSRGARAPYRLPQQPEFLFSEESTLHRRSWSENLTFYTGVGYLTGALTGGAYGALQALPRPPDVAQDSARLRLNRLLNLSGRSGRASGNALGALGLFFSSFESSIGYFSDGRTPDEVNTLVAGFCTGALYRGARGLRVAGVSGGIGAVAAGALLAGRQYVSKAL